MKIMQIIPVLDLAGAEIMCENLSMALKNKGHDVIVVSLYTKKTVITERLNSVGIPVIYLDKHLGFDFTMYRKLISLMKKEQPDIVHMHLYLGKYVVPAALISGIKGIVYTIHSIAEKESTYIGKLLNSMFFKLNNLVPVALSASVQKTIVDFYNIPLNCAPVVLNGIPLNKCLVKENYTIDGDFSIIHVGRLFEAKNHMEILKAMRILRDRNLKIHLTLIGDGELRKSIMDKIKELNLQEMISWIPSTGNVYSYLHDADLFLLPSKYEGIPMSIIEAMGTGLPIVASAVGGIPDMISNGKTGLLCETSAESIAEKIARFMSDENLRSKCGRNAVIEAKRFSSDTMAERYVEIYKKIIEVIIDEL